VGYFVVETALILPTQYYFVGVLRNIEGRIEYLDRKARFSGALRSISLQS
jgi:hypothetical protein